MVPYENDTEILFTARVLHESSVWDLRWHFLLEEYVKFWVATRWQRMKFNNYNGAFYTVFFLN